LLELVRPGETGFLATSGRPESLAAAAALVLEDPARARAVAERAAVEAAERFSLTAEVRTLERILEEALER
jgi:glycosyltransferase involved in cell wall biosynthesis